MEEIFHFEPHSLVVEIVDVLVPWSCYDTGIIRPITMPVRPRMELASQKRRELSFVKDIIYRFKISGSSSTSNFAKSLWETESVSRYDPVRRLPILTWMAGTVKDHRCSVQVPNYRHGSCRASSATVEISRHRDS